MMNAIFEIFSGFLNLDVELGRMFGINIIFTIQEALFYYILNKKWVSQNVENVFYDEISRKKCL